MDRGCHGQTLDRYVRHYSRLSHTTKISSSEQPVFSSSSYIELRQSRLTQVAILNEEFFFYFHTKFIPFPLWVVSSTVSLTNRENIHKIEHDLLLLLFVCFCTWRSLNYSSLAIKSYTGQQSQLYTT